MTVAEIRRSATRAAAAHQTTPQPAALPPAIILGGSVNALSIARSLGRHGVAVYALNQPHAYVHASRYARRIDIPLRGDTAAAWLEYLSGAESGPLRGAVLLAAGDEGIDFLIRRREALAGKYRLDECEPAAQRCMLNKLCTYQAATAAGVATPRYWVATSRAEIDRVRSELVYPLIVKPQLSHLFEAHFGTKFLVVDRFDELGTALDTAAAARFDVLLMEKIVGPDDRLASYYTYLDEQGVPLFDFTKRILRRFPVNMGAGCYHITHRDPELRALALRLFQHVGLRGLANAEFKHDDRDGQWKLIECNARFTAANGLLMDCGLDLPWFVYSRLVGLAPPPMSNYRSGVRLWYPVEDFKAFLQLRRRGELTLWRWLASVLHPQTLPYFRFRDPWPSVVGAWRRIAGLVWRGVRPTTPRAVER